MVNSSRQVIDELKSKQLGALLSGTASTVQAKPITGISLSETASNRLARSQPTKSSTAFINQIRESGKRMHETALAGIAAKREAERKRAEAEAQARLQAMGQRRPSQGGGGGGRFPASGYRAPSGGGERDSKTGQYGYQSFGGRYGLTVPASNAFSALENAYRSQFGQGFTVSSGWRSMEQEAYHWDRYQRGVGPIASKPGTGVHGYGTAVDINGPINNTGSAQHNWLRQNAAQFGWFWIGQRFGEPWHWEYYPNHDPRRGQW